MRLLPCPLLAEEDVLDEPSEDLVGAPEVDADDDAGDEHDDRPLDQLRLRRPFDLLQLAPRLADEVEVARTCVRRRARLRLGPPLGAAAVSAVRDGTVGLPRRRRGSLLAPRLPARGALRTRLPRHRASGSPGAACAAGTSGSTS